MAKREGAFTVAEVLLALGFLATVLVAAAGLFISAVKASDESAKTAPALLAGRALLEETRHDLKSNPETPQSQEFWSQEFIASPWLEEIVRIGDEDFLCRVYTSDVLASTDTLLGGSPQNRLKKVRVEVSWREGEARGYGILSKELVTLFER